MTVRILPIICAQRVVAILVGSTNILMCYGERRLMQSCTYDLVNGVHMTPSPSSDARYQFYLLYICRNITSSQIFDTGEVIASSSIHLVTCGMRSTYLRPFRHLNDISTIYRHNYQQSFLQHFHVDTVSSMFKRGNTWFQLLLGLH